MPIRKHMILLPFQFLTAMVLGGFVLTASANTGADAVAKEAPKRKFELRTTRLTLHVLLIKWWTLFQQKQKL
ncbi:MAG: hypothetical protein EBZ56_02650 [Burkholderiaceae bacterium]|nr:hypothetical protein [Burkholderiaceae bacterium]